MRGRSQDQGGTFSYIHPEKRIPAYHSLRKIRELVREVLKELNHTFGRLYSHEGRPSIPPEQLLSALILQVLYLVRSERQLMEQLEHRAFEFAVMSNTWSVNLATVELAVFGRIWERLGIADVLGELFVVDGGLRHRRCRRSRPSPFLSRDGLARGGTGGEARGRAGATLRQAHLLHLDLLSC